MKIFEPIKVGNIVLKNRIMFPPLTTGYENRDGSMSEQSMAFYERIAQGGAGYIVLGDVCPVSSFSPTPKLYDDSQIAKYGELVSRVHKYGAKIGAQIFYPEYNVQEISRLATAGEMVSVRERLHYDMQHFTDEVTPDMLREIIKIMCNCAVRAEQAGIDIIQIHGDRLVGTLCSSKMNHRTDEYGGSFENRMRFALTLVREMKAAVPKMPLDYKFTVHTKDRGNGGVSEDEAPAFAKLLESVGIDMLHVAQANHTSNMADTIPPMGVQPYGFFTDIAWNVKKSVSIPVSTVGRIIDPNMAEQVLGAGKADIVGIGRPLLADPDWVNKAVADKACDIRQCISCNKGCTDRIQSRNFLSCVLNAENGYETSRKILPAAMVKNIVVIGGGVAGLEAARVAAQKGHQVTLFEQEARLGGQLNLAAVPPRKAEMNRALTFLVHAVLQAKIVLRLGETATMQSVLALKPDAVIVATGAQSFSLPVAGVEGANVCDAWEILSGTQRVYGRVAVIGGGLVGCETSEYLAVSGCNVAIVEMTDTIAQDEGNTVRPTMLAEFQRLGVTQYVGHKLLEITPKAVLCSTSTDETISIPCDYVVMAVGAKPVAFDTWAFEQAGIPVYFIGDCAKGAKDISAAIRSAYDTANAL